MEKLPKLSGVYIDCDFVNDPKVQIIIQEHGGAGAFYLVQAYLALARESGARLSQQHLLALSCHAGVTRDSAVTLLREFVSQKLLYFDDDYYFHPRLVEEQEKVLKQREAWRKRQSMSRVTHASVTVPHKEEEQEQEEEQEAPKKAGYFSAEGHDKFLDWVYLKSGEYEKLLEFYNAGGLTKPYLDYAITRLDAWYQDNQKMRNKRNCDFKALKGWPFERARDAKTQKLRIDNLEARNGQHKPTYVPKREPITGIAKTLIAQAMPKAS